MLAYAFGERSDREKPKVFRGSARHLRIRHNDSANAESKAACAALLFRGGYAMLSMKNFDTFDTMIIYENLTNLSNYSEMKEALSKMAQERGGGFSDSINLAETVIRGVARYEVTRMDVGENVQTAMQTVLDQIKDTDPDRRMSILSQMLFALDICSNDEMMAKLDYQSGEALYNENWGSNLIYTPEGEAELQERLLEKVASFNLSPKALERMTAGLGKTNDYTATAAALGREGFELKCVAATHLYLCNRSTMDIPEAINIACVHTDMQAVADSVCLGLISRNVADIILKCILISVVALCGSFMVAMVIHDTTLGWILSVLFSMNLVDTLSEVFESTATDMCSLPIGFPRLVQKGSLRVYNGMKKIKTYMADRMAETEGDVSDTLLYEDDWG